MCNRHTYTFVHFVAKKITKKTSQKFEREAKKCLSKTIPTKSSFPKVKDCFGHSPGLNARGHPPPMLLGGTPPSLVPSLSFSRVGRRAGEEKEGPGTHCLRMRHKNLMNLIIK